jgi:hypothetical protein
VFRNADILLMLREIPKHIYVLAAGILRHERDKRKGKLPFSILDLGGAITPLIEELLGLID